MKKRILALREKAQKDIRKVILSEGEDVRVVKAAGFLAKNRIADITLLGKKEELAKLAKDNSISLDGVSVIDPTTHDKQEMIINRYYELRKHKGMTVDEARKLLLSNFVYYGAVMTSMDMAEGFVAGANHTTADVARSAIHCFNILREIGTVSSCFIMELDNGKYGSDGLFVYADCGIIPYPSAKQLASIAIAASQLFEKVFDEKARTAMLSFSTKGSAEGDSITVVRDALAKVKEKMPDMLIDGELQADAALVPEVGMIKCKNSPVAGRANVLIFPNLDAGNIAYKITERLAGATAIGPIIQGLDKPNSDLSRGCSWEDVVDAVAVTAVRAQQKVS
jgi:phosphate acetyltransferase